MCLNHRELQYGADRHPYVRGNRDYRYPTLTVASEADVRDILADLKLDKVVKVSWPPFDLKRRNMNTRARQRDVLQRHREVWNDSRSSGGAIGWKRRIRRATARDHGRTVGAPGSGPDRQYRARSRNHDS
jgi:hypothetical protein